MRAVEKADELFADAARQTDARKQKKALDKARKTYSTALRKFAQAIELQSGMYQAWNYLGYSQRKLGNYQDALIAYDRALSIKPGYAEAIEYRGHAYLGLNRLSEAKESYLALYRQQPQARGQPARRPCRSGWARIAPTPRESMAPCSSRSPRG